MRENKAKKTKIRSKMKGRGAFRLVKNRFFKGGIFVEIQLVLKNKELKVCVDISNTLKLGLSLQDRIMVLGQYLEIMDTTTKN